MEETKQTPKLSGYRKLLGNLPEGTELKDLFGRLDEDNNFHITEVLLCAPDGEHYRVLVRNGVAITKNVHVPTPAAYIEKSNEVMERLKNMSTAEVLAAGKRIDVK